MLLAKLIVIGIFVGLSLGLTGGGGSIIAIPSLIYGASLSLESALFVSLILVASIASLGALRHYRLGSVDLFAALCLSLCGVIVSPFFAHLSHSFSDTWRIILFSIFMLFSGYRMASSLKASKQVMPDTQKKPKFSHIIFSGIIAGALAGFFGVGGGFIIVPLLSIIFAMPYKKAVGTSLIAIALISFSAFVNAYYHGARVEVNFILMLFFGGIFGLVMSSYFVNKMPEKFSKLSFSFITILIAIFMIFDKLIFSGVLL